MWRNKPERRERNLFVFQGECMGPHFGIVRTTWYDNGQISGIQETRLRDSRDWVVNTAKFTAVVGTALREGADVSVYIDCDPADLGLENL